VIGLLVGELVQPAKGFNIDPATLDAAAVSSYITRAHEESLVGHLLANSFFDERSLIETGVLRPKRDPYQKYRRPRPYYYSPHQPAHVGCTYVQWLRAVVHC
jgi:hypothetical protein